MTRWIAFMDSPCGSPCGRSSVPWRDDVALFIGARLSGHSAVDVRHLTEVEVRSHRLMAQHREVHRAHAPGFEQASPMLSAPQLGVRHSRRLPGVARVMRERAIERCDAVGG